MSMFIRNLESIIQALQAYFGLECRECVLHIYLIFMESSLFGILLGPDTDFDVYYFLLLVSFIYTS
jgi:hypothetical protein